MGRGKKRLKPDQLRRVGGLALLSLGFGMLIALLAPGFAIFGSILTIALGFYFLFL